MGKAWVRRLSLGVVVALICATSIITPLLAIDVPDGNPTITSIYAYEHYLETGDQLYIIGYNWPYTGTFPTDYPTETASQAVICRLLNGATELANTSPVRYFTNGWGTGYMAIYFSAATAPAWNGVYTVKIEGDPLLSWSSTIPVVTSTAITWQTAPVSVAATQLELTGLIPNLASTLEIVWDITLTSSANGVTYLSSYGDAYFTAVIPGLHAAIPNAFGDTLIAVTPQGNNKGTAYADSLRAGITGTIFDLGGISGLVGLPATLILSAIYTAGCLFLLYKIAVWQNTAKYMVLEGVPFAIVGGVIGVYPMIVPIVIALGAGILFLTSIFGGGDAGAV